MADNKMVLLVLKKIGEKIEAEKEYLTELDQPIGDSDHGINLARGFQEAERKGNSGGSNHAGCHGSCS